MRLFVAVYPPPEIRDKLIRSARDLPTDAFRLTAPERVHLTLKFLGEIPPEALPRITSALEPLGDAAEPFEAAIAGFGVFPSARRARILWAGIEEGAEAFRALANTVETLLEPEGLPPEGRPFVPHLTLGRARRPARFDPGHTPLPEERFAVRKADLVQSEHGGSGVVYSTLEEYEF